MSYAETYPEIGKASVQHSLILNSPLPAGELRSGHIA